MCTGTMGCGRSVCSRREQTTAWASSTGGYEGVVETADCVHSFFEEDLPSVSGSYGFYEGSSTA